MLKVISFLIIILISFNIFADNLANTQDETTEIHDDINKNKDRKWTGSLMFSKADLTKINIAIQESLHPRSVKINNTDTPTSSIINSLSGTSPSYYLNSIIYNNDNDWIIWVNGQKISSDDPSNNMQITVRNVTPKYVEFETNSGNLNSLSPNWGQQLNNISGNLYANIKNNIRLNQDTGLIAFKLYPNQTFLMYQMAIKEGFASGTIIEQSENTNNNVKSIPTVATK
jgi:hypothetical protein